MVIVTTDGSERSAHAFSPAATLAEALSLELRLLQVIDEGEIASSSSGPKEALGQMQDRLQETIKAAGIDATPVAAVRREGEDVAGAIIRAARELRAQVLAMDSRGHGAIRHALTGSVAMSVLGRSALPVMMTGPNAGAAPTPDAYHVLVTSDGSETSENVLVAMRPFLSAVTVSLLTVYVRQLGDRGDRVELAACREHLTGVQRRLLSGVRCSMIVKLAEDPRHVNSIIIGTARDLQASAIAMSTRGYAARRHVLLGSTAADVLRHSPVPVLLARQ